MKSAGVESLFEKQFARYPFRYQIIENFLKTSIIIIIYCSSAVLKKNHPTNLKMEMIGSQELNWGRIEEDWISAMQVICESIAIRIGSGIGQ